MTFAACSVDVSSTAASGKRSSQRERNSQAIDEPSPVRGATKAQRVAGQPMARLGTDPTMQAVAGEIEAIARGQVMTVSALRARLAVRHGGQACSAAALGRCLVLLAGVVASDLRRGRRGRWPIWRVVNDDGQLPGNWPLDARWRAAMLRDEGQVIRYLRSSWAVA
jgi:alkylated DNA nucleotide flippase Atl1